MCGPNRLRGLVLSVSPPCLLSNQEGACRDYEHKQFATHVTSCLVTVENHQPLLPHTNTVSLSELKPVVFYYYYYYYCPTVSRSIF